MLNTKALSELLTKNVHPKLCPSLFAMSPKGTLIAYSTPANIKQVRDQAALISMGLKDAALDESGNRQPVHTITIQVDAHNIVARRVTPTTFVVLVGCLPPYLQRDFRIVIERDGDARFPPSAATDDGDLNSVLSKAQDMQRSKLDALCDFIHAELSPLSEDRSAGGIWT